MHKKSKFPTSTPDTTNIRCNLALGSGLVTDRPTSRIDKALKVVEVAAAVAGSGVSEPVLTGTCFTGCSLIHGRQMVEYEYS